MPVSITIRHIPDGTRDTLAARAARSGRSLQEYLSAELQRLAAQPSVDDWLADATAAARNNPEVGAGELLADLESDRR